MLNDPTPSMIQLRPLRRASQLTLTPGLSSQRTSRPNGATSSSRANAWRRASRLGRLQRVGDDDNACFEPRANFPGNTVYFGLGASGQPVSQPWRWAKSGISILSFMLGSFVF
jgi:hypothetical protein